MTAASPGEITLVSYIRIPGKALYGRRGRSDPCSPHTPVSIQLNGLCHRWCVAFILLNNDGRYRSSHHDCIPSSSREEGRRTSCP